MTERDRHIQQRGRELMDLVIRRLPQDFEVASESDFWPGIGVGLLCRMTTTLGSILDLHVGRRQADAATLVRSLYEHAVHFAWLAAEPSASRIEEWRKQDLVDRLKADADTSRHGVPMLKDATRVSFTAQVASMRGRELRLADLAVAADQHWAGKVRGMGKHTELESFRGWYALLYRFYSGMAHPSLRGLNQVFDQVGPTRRRFHLEGEYSGSGPYGMATFVYGVTLYVAGQSIGWPSADDVSGIFDSNPD